MSTEARFHRKISKKDPLRVRAIMPLFGLELVKRFALSPFGLAFQVTSHPNRQKVAPAANKRELRKPEEEHQLMEQPITYPFSTEIRTRQEWRVVEQFEKREDAVAHVDMVRKQVPHGEFRVVQILHQYQPKGEAA